MGMSFQVVVGLISIGLFVFCDYTITRWAERVPSDGYWTWGLLTVVIAAPLSAVAFGLVGARVGLAAVSGFVNTGIVLGGVLVGVALRGDQLTTWQKVGLIFGLVAMLLMNLGKTETTSAPS
jgi:drug/metabolite transporter (DMT)-like permease